MMEESSQDASKLCNPNAGASIETSNEEVHDMPGRSSAVGATFNIANAALGAGVLLFPQMMARNGWFVGLLSMVAGVLIMGGTLHILALAAYETRQTTYQDAVSRTVHRLCAKGIDVTMSLYLFGTCASYLVLIAEQLLTVANADSWWNRFFVISVVAVLEVPLMLLRDIDMLQATSAFGVFTNCFVALVIMYGCASRVMSHGIHPDVVGATGDTYATASAFGLYAFSFQCHLIFIPVYWTLRTRSVRKMDGVILAAYILCFVVYAACGILGYFAYGEEVNIGDGDILANNLPSNAWTTVARVCLAIKTFVSYPLLHFPARLCLGDLWVDGDVREARYRLQYYTTTAFFLILTWALAIGIGNLSVLVNITSALLGVFQVFVWPGLMYWKLGSHHLSPARRSLRCVIGWALVILGLSVTVFGVYDQIRLL